MLHRARLPDDEEAWRLPSAEIPRLHSLTAASRPSPLGEAELWWVVAAGMAAVVAASVIVDVIEHNTTKLF